LKKEDELIMWYSNTRKVLVTGGSRGIGKAIVAELQSSGAAVAAPTRDELDLANVDSVKNFLQQHDSTEFDIIVNCAGINILSELENIKDEDIEKVFRVNYFSPLQIIQYFVPGMKKNNYGRIINISSLYALVSKERRTSYSSSKSAISGLTRTLALELGVNNILVNAVCPGYVDTEMTRVNLKEHEIAEISNSIPLKRMAKPEEIAKTVVFLGSDINTYITGQLIVADGGFICR
jgi:3-oxoacyl-[acyl-carrier protein] reductase